MYVQPYNKIDVIFIFLKMPPIFANHKKWRRSIFSSYHATLQKKLAFQTDRHNTNSVVTGFKLTGVGFGSSGVVGFGAGFSDGWFLESGELVAGPPGWMVVLEQPNNKNFRPYL